MHREGDGNADAALGEIASPAEASDSERAIERANAALQRAALSRDAGSAYQHTLSAWQTLQPSREHPQIALRLRELEDLLRKRATAANQASQRRDVVRRKPVIIE